MKKASKILGELLCKNKSAFNEKLKSFSLNIFLIREILTVSASNTSVS